ncbi:spore coat protein [Oceanobacillus alkalisoli]|uniref:spore coat protein n=1 Tax=Oceanobacillus alkalisoli TaxID=2925113 RepID=UPI001EF0C98F|nr:spore coat protein [Oceanobacillus alkalisoli]MCF3943119.1 spore coat protein [Oceanobacillus alkalisoli]MCG5104703.1 spore coat protein [Oceanobacillus alkalisoli]
MTIYRHSEYDFDLSRGKGDRYSYFMEEPLRSCSCGHSCSGKCSNESSNRPTDTRAESDFTSNNNAFEMQEGTELSFMDQESAELIWVKESCNITVSSTDTQIGVSLQAALQLAIALVLNISIADGTQRDAVSQELTQNFNMAQKNKQKIFIYNTKDAVVTTRDTDLALNLQLMLQVLVALLLLVEIL